MSLDLIVIKKNDKYYIRHKKDKYFNFVGLSFDKGELPSFSENWKICSEVPFKLCRFHSATTKVIGYKLKEGFAVSEKTPLELPEDAFEYLGCDKYKNSDIRSLYESVSDTIAEWYEDVEFSIELIDEDCEPLIKNKYPFVAQFPYFIENHEAVRHKYPCYISSEELFKIIVKYCKENLPEHCKITSDYEFSFTVELILPILHEEDRLVDISRFNSKKPKYEKRPLRELRFPIIDICTPKHNYGLVISPINAENYQELETKIDSLLLEYKQLLSQKLAVCSHCKGYGFNKS